MMDNNPTSERGWIFHRTREQPIPDPKEPPINQIKFYLDRYKIKEALQIFFEENTLNLLKIESDFMWDIIPLICKRLRGLCQYRFRVFEGCERMLCRIAVDVNCNPKEVLISLLAELNHHSDYDDDNVFRAMIRPLEGTLMRMNSPSPRDENFRWVLNVLMRHINNIDLPQEYNLEGKKRLSLPNDPSVKRFIEILPLMLSFIEEFNDRPIDFDRASIPILTESQINEVLNGELVDDDILSDQSDTRSPGMNASITALTTLIHRPFTFLDITVHCADLRLFANRYINALLKLCPDLFSPIYKRLIEKSFRRDNIESYINILNVGTCQESTLSLATCSYLYRCERLILHGSVQSFPQILTHESSLYCHLPFVVSLLERSEILVHEKGLLLLDSLLAYIDHDTLGQRYLNLFEASSLNKQLFQIMVFSPLYTNRRRAFDIFTIICNLLTSECKLKLFKSVLIQEDSRPCIKAACVDQYRKHLASNYKENMNLDDQHLALLSNRDIEFLDTCIKACLPESRHTDIIENYELLLATLSLFRFLKLRRTSSQDIAEETYLKPSKLKKIFFDPLRSVIALIMSELKLHLKELSEGTKRSSGNHDATKTLDVSQSRNEMDLLTKILGPKSNDIFVPNDNLSCSQEDEINCLNWALCRLDLVESVLVRTCDIYNC